MIKQCLFYQVINHSSTKLYSSVLPMNIAFFICHHQVTDEKDVFIIKFPNIMAATSYCGTTVKILSGVGMNLFESYACVLRAAEHLQRSRAEREVHGGLQVPWEHTCLFCLGITGLGTETPLST